MMATQIKFNKESNRIEIPLEYVDDKAGLVLVTPHLLRAVLPPPATIEEKIAEIEQLIHEIHKDKLVNVREYIKTLHDLSDGEAKVRDQLASCEGKDVKRYAEIARTWLDQKNILREVRYAIRLLEEEEKIVREEKLKIEAGIISK